MRAMDLKHDVLYSNGGRPKGPSVIKSEPRSLSPCYSQGLHSPPNLHAGGGGIGLFGNIVAAKRTGPNDWLTPQARSPVTSISLPPNSTSGGGGPQNLSSSPGLHPGIYPSTSNGYPSPTMSAGSYEPYSSSSKLSEY